MTSDLVYGKSSGPYTFFSEDGTSESIVLEASTAFGQGNIGLKVTSAMGPASSSSRLPRICLRSEGATPPSSCLAAETACVNDSLLGAYFSHGIENQRGHRGSDS